jgi:hypothetical protein
VLDRLTRNRRRAAELRRLRDQRHRARVKACRACYTIEADGEVLDLLVRARWISEEALTDKAAVERAIGEMLAASARI